MKRTALVKYLDTLFRVTAIEDASQNGLQVEGAAEVTRVAFAVDACQTAFEQAAAAGAQLLIVHHGLFWGRPLLITGVHARRVETLLRAGVSLYAVHLPLDLHPTLGHNARLAAELGLRSRRPFGKDHNILIGFSGALPRPLPLPALVARVTRVLGAPPLRVLAHGPRLTRRIGCVSGGAAHLLAQAAEAGLDTYLTGETRHAAFHEARELRLNVIFGGHYATEVPGLKALSAHLRRRLGLQTVLLDLPTGW